MPKKEKLVVSSMKEYISLCRGGSVEVEFCPLPVETPTDARPGSAQKVEILRQRFEADQELHHPMDRQDWLPPSLYRKNRDFPLNQGNVQDPVRTPDGSLRPAAPYRIGGVSPADPDVEPVRKRWQR